MKPSSNPNKHDAHELRHLHQAIDDLHENVIKSLSALTRKFSPLTKGVDMANASIQALRDKIVELQQAQSNAEAREKAQDEATTLQIENLQASIDQLKEQINPDDNPEILSEVVPQIQSVIDALNKQKQMEPENPTPAPTPTEPQP